MQSQHDSQRIYVDVYFKKFEVDREELIILTLTLYHLKLENCLNTHYCDDCHVADVSICKETCNLFYTHLFLAQHDYIPRPEKKEMETLGVFVRLF